MNPANADVVCALRRPVTLVAVGVLFALDHFTRYPFSRTWPVLLIVYGLLWLACRSAGAPAQGPGGGAR